MMQPLRRLRGSESRRSSRARQQAGSDHKGQKARPRTRATRCLPLRRRLPEAISMIADRSGSASSARDEAVEGHKSLPVAGVARVAALPATASARDRRWLNRCIATPRGSHREAGGQHDPGGQRRMQTGDFDGDAVEDVCDADADLGQSDSEYDRRRSAQAGFAPADPRGDGKRPDQQADASVRSSG